MFIPFYNGRYKVNLSGKICKKVIKVILIVEFIYRTQTFEIFLNNILRNLTFSIVFLILTGILEI